MKFSTRIKEKKFEDMEKRYPYTDSNRRKFIVIKKMLEKDGVLITEK